MNLRENYLFSEHSKTEVRRWCDELRWFRFCRAYGGHAGDGDSFQTAIEFADEAELLAITRDFGIALNVLPPDFPRPVVGQKYTASEFNRFPLEIKAFPHLEQPGWSEIFGVRVYVWIEATHVVLSLGGAEGDLYAVSERDFQNARALERSFERFNWRFAHPPRGCQCLCAECEPALWKDF